MDPIFWQFGGPAQFVDRMVDDLREGKNVVVCLPKHVPSGLDSSVKCAVNSSLDLHWQPLQLRNEDLEPPATFLARQILPDLPTSIINTSTLLSQETFPGRVVWLKGMSARAWPAWQRFLVEYSHACKSVPLLDRTLLCVLLVEELGESPPPMDVCLACHEWRGIVDSLDALLFSSQLLHDHLLPPFQKRLLASIGAHLALWDPIVAMKLVEAGTEAFFEPYPVLKEVAEERGWSGANAPYCWSQGQIDLFDGRELPHSAALVCNGTSKDIVRRIWSAQVGVLFPFVEQERQSLLEQFKGVLRVPFTTRFGETITDRRDLEIGHIESQLGTDHSRVPRKTRRWIRHLRKIRNCLAHQEVVPRELLFDN